MIEKTNAKTTYIYEKKKENEIMPKNVLMVSHTNESWLKEVFFVHTECVTRAFACVCVCYNMYLTFCYDCIVCNVCIGLFKITI